MLELWHRFYVDAETPPSSPVEADVRATAR
jgi:hypothetical protein